jgi:predicted nucleic acid-binding protein
MRYVLDTTLLIDTANGLEAARGAIDRLFSAPNDLYTCDAIVCEALSGGSDEEREAISRLLSSLEYVSTTPEAATRAAESRRRSGRTSRRTLADALIAGVAWFNDATIVTRNPRDFEAQGVAVLTYG